MNNIWTSQEIDFLKNNYTCASIEQLQEVLKRSKRAIQCKACLMGIATNKRHWTEGEELQLIALLREYKYSAAEIGIMLERSKEAIRNKINIMGIIERPLSPKMKENINERKTIC